MSRENLVPNSNWHKQLYALETSSISKLSVPIFKRSLFHNMIVLPADIGTESSSVGRDMTLRVGHARESMLSSIFFRRKAGKGMKRGQRMKFGESNKIKYDFVRM